jgi:deoxyribose-phosphate aldolase
VLTRASRSRKSPVNFNESLDSLRSLASFIDHTLLKPEAGREDIARLCREAREFGFHSVCVNPCWVRFAATELEGSGVRVCAVAGFPLGASRAALKVSEAELAMDDGAGEIDMVQNIGLLRSGETMAVKQEITEIAAAAHARGAILKVIIEACLLDEARKREACLIAQEAGADFVKTSTGFAASGATVDDVKLMRRVVGASMGVKASGGIRSLAAMRTMLAAGASRIGTSSGVSILAEAKRGGASDPVAAGPLGARPEY